MSWGKEVCRDLCDSLGVGSGRKGRQRQVFCYTVGDETGDWICRSQRGVDLLSDYLLP